MDVFIGTILGFGFNFAPRNWAFCAGQTIAISQNSALYSLLGTTYGGNGTTNFLLPNLVGRVPISFGSGGTGGTASYALGQAAGSESTTLLVQNMPAHNHAINVSNTADATTNKPSNVEYLGQCVGSDPTNGDAVTVNIYTPAAPNAQLNPTSMSIVGGSQPFNNMQPYLAVNYCIALYGIFPSRN
ncbi:phage tail protein [Brevundimonas sp.]|uniref:phage tail protein n=1 Tax=Brevundimonas sp. TaxID=1871086 RepID=UPI003F6F8DF7